ncbi:DRTGG domain-containing protein [Lentibacillus saliphilus]|uniref:DRTGG domain-containing protein n=1 Tax=Lentibacillus saliphilus TaxID=2737028 RepID=UPI001C3104DA|nr:DRTGG domain-containing protein [Lentibacillus saliphilus]
MTKHEQIIRYIESLDIGHKISVRLIAKHLDVSEGTAYRAIKEAENQGLVSTIERVGTIRIEQKKRENIENLTFAEVINVVDGQVLGGAAGLHKTLNKFLIGAMQVKAIKRYIEADSLLIVGDRTEAQELALEEGAAVLITGGFDTTARIKQLADEKALPIMSTSYDTFTVAAMINRAIYDQLIKKEIVCVSDIYTPVEKAAYLTVMDTVDGWYALNEQTRHTRFPVVDKTLRVKGMVTYKDIMGKQEHVKLDKIMVKNPIVVHPKTSLAYAAHIMVWEGIEVVPVVDKGYLLEGVVSRRDVLKALQQIQRQPQIGEKMEDIVASHMDMVTEERGQTAFKMTVIPQMTNQLGTLADGVFTSIMNQACRKMLQHEKRADISIENMTIYFIQPVPIDSQIIIKPKIMEIGRMYAKLDVDMYCNKQLVGKGMLMGQVIVR